MLGEVLQCERSVWLTTKRETRTDADEVGCTSRSSRHPRRILDDLADIDRNVLHRYTDLPPVPPKMGGRGFNGREPKKTRGIRCADAPM